MTAINNTLKKIQNAELDLLAQFTTWCDEHDIEYWISWGTALGAVRHSGWIPWDDDVDIDMPIESIKKLVKLWKTQGIKGLFLQTQETDPNLPYLFLRIRKDGSTTMDKGGEYIPLHWGLSIDIFPLFNCPNWAITKRLQKRLYLKANKLSQYPWKNFGKSRYSTFQAKINRAEMALLLRIAIVISSCSKNSGKMAFWWIDKDRFFLTDDIYPLQRITFETNSFFIVNNYDKYLTELYGDYMQLPPVEQRKNHGYYIFDLNKDFREYVSYNWEPKKYGYCSIKKNK